MLSLTASECWVLVTGIAFGFLAFFGGRSLMDVASAKLTDVAMVVAAMLAATLALHLPHALGRLYFSAFIPTPFVCMLVVAIWPLASEIGKRAMPENQEEPEIFI